MFQSRQNGAPRCIRWLFLAAALPVVSTGCQTGGHYAGAPIMARPGLARNLTSSGVVRYSDEYGTATKDVKVVQVDHVQAETVVQSETVDEPNRLNSLPAPSAEGAAPSPNECVAAPSVPGNASPANADSPESWTLARFEQMALESNPTLRQAFDLVRRAEGRTVQAGLYPNPTVGYVGEEIGDDDTAGQQGGFLRQRIVTAGKLQLSQEASAQTIAQSHWQAEAQRIRVLNEVRIRYFEILGAQRTVQITEELEEIALKGVETAKTLTDALVAPETDVLQAEVELSRVQLLLANARQRETMAWRQLAAVVGVSQLSPAPLAEDIEQTQPQLNEEESRARILSSHPLLGMRRSAVEQARGQVCREQVEPIPDLQVQTGVVEDTATDFTLFSAQIGIELPIFDRNQGNISAAAADLHRAMNELSRFELALANRFAEVFARYDMARIQAESYRESILPKADETLSLTTEGYEQGQINFFRVITARRSYFENELNYISALVEMQTAAVEIEGLLLTGGLNSVSGALSNSSGGSPRSTAAGTLQPAGSIPR